MAVTVIIAGDVTAGYFSVRGVDLQDSRLAVFRRPAFTPESWIV